MLFPEEKFYHEALDLSVPELKLACDLFDRGDVPAAEHAFAAYMKTVLRPQIYLADKTPRNLSDSEKKTLLGKADVICDGVLSSVGFPHRFENNQFDWEINPTFNKYCEWTWQLSRHPEFVTLSNAYAVTGDEKYACQYVRLITSWIDQCVCPESISGYATLTWRTIEAGIRMLGSWHVAIHTFVNSPSVSDGTWVKIFRSVYEHVYRLRGFRTSHNWLIMEMGGLVNIAVLYSFFRDTKEWFDDGMKTLENELYVQLYPDSFQYELSTGYHGCNIGNYRNVMSLCRKFGIAVPQKFYDGIHLMYEMYVKLCRPDRLTPGLNDGGNVNVAVTLKSALETYENDPVFTWFATDGKEGTAPEYTSVVLPYAGQVVMRQDWSKEAIFAHFDGGPFGFAHQHEDKLNFQMFAYGADMLPDEGTYAYDSSNQRKYVLGTRSHNTGLVDGKGQSRREIYKWNDEDITKKAEELRYRNGADYEVCESVYDDGYGKRPNVNGKPAYPEFYDSGKVPTSDSFINATHRRKVVFFKKGFSGLPPFFVLLDRFDAEEEHTFEVSFQLTEDETAVVGGRTFTRFGNGATMTVVGDTYPKLTVGQYEPEYMGWRSIHGPEEHEHAPAPVLSFAKRKASANFATVIVPAKSGNVAPVKVSCDDTSFTLTVNGASETFLYADDRFGTDPV